MTTQLDWFPLEIRDYLQRTALLSPAEEGALMRAIVTSWDGALRGAPAGTLPENDAAFARLYGADWQALLSAVRVHFQPDPEYPGQLRCAWLAELYERQQQRHAMSVKKGKEAQERRRKIIEERRKQRGKQKGTKGLSSTQVEPELNSTPTGSSTQAETSFEIEIPSGGSPSEIPPRGDSPDVAAVGRGGATAAPPSNDPIPIAAPASATRVPLAVAPPAPPTAPATRSLSRGAARPQLVRDVPIAHDTSAGTDPTTAELERWLDEHPDAAAEFQREWHRQTELTPGGDPGFLRVPSLRAIWRRFHPSATARSTALSTGVHA